MTPNKQPISTDHQIIMAYNEAFTQVKGYSPVWGDKFPRAFIQIIRKLLSEYELVPYQPEDSLGVVVEVTEENGATSRFVNVASGKWYCDGRPTGSRFLNTRAIQHMNPRPA
jgi:hypothetical protein